MTRTQKVEKLAAKLQNMVQGVETASDSLIDALMQVIDAQTDREVLHQIMRRKIQWASGMSRVRLMCIYWG